MDTAPRDSRTDPPQHAQRCLVYDPQLDRWGFAYWWRTQGFEVGGQGKVIPLPDAFWWLPEPAAPFSMAPEKRNG